MEYLQNLQSSDTFIENLYTNYRSFMLCIISRYLNESFWQEDVFHEVFIRILQKADFLRTLPPQKLETYLLLMTRGVSIDFLRKNHFNEQDDLADDILLELVDTHAIVAPGPVDPIAKTDLKIMLEHISADDLTLLIGKYYLGLESNELATISGMTSTAIRSRIHRTKSKLFEKWKATGLTMEDFIYG